MLNTPLVSGLLKPRWWRGTVEPIWFPGHPRLMTYVSRLRRKPGGSGAALCRPKFIRR